MDEWCFDKPSGRVFIRLIDGYGGAERDDSAWSGEAEGEGEGRGRGRRNHRQTGRWADGQRGSGAKVTHRTGAREAMGTSGTGGIVRSPMYAQGGSMWEMNTQRRQYIHSSPVVLEQRMASVPRASIRTPMVGIS